MNTLPHINTVVPSDKAYKIINDSTDSTTATANLSFLGSAESVLLGLDSETILNTSYYYGIPISAIKISQKVDFPLTGINFLIRGVTLNYGKSNSSLSLVTITNKGNIVQYLYSYLPSIPGNYTLTFYVHITTIGIIGIYHFKGNTVTEKLTINVRIYS